MPKKDIDYSKTIIYKIVCKDINITDLYVGHTTNFTKRKGQHKSSCNNANSKNYNLYVYKFIRDNGGWDNWDMIEIEKYPCNDVNEACKRERYYMETLKATLNQIIPTRTRKEYLEDNKQNIQEQTKQYRLLNKEKIKELKKQYHIQNKAKILEHKKQKKHCDYCNCDFTICHFKRHERTEKHQNNLQRNNLENE